MVSRSSSLDKDVALSGSLLLQAGQCAPVKLTFTCVQQLGRREPEPRLQEVFLPLMLKVPGLQLETALLLQGSLTMQWALNLQRDPQPPREVNSHKGLLLPQVGFFSVFAPELQCEKQLPGNNLQNSAFCCNMALCCNSEHNSGDFGNLSAPPDDQHLCCRCLKVFLQQAFLPRLL